jgi:tetratricopeptide (TPR) repeat protein
MSYDGLIRELLLLGEVDAAEAVIETADQGTYRYHQRRAHAYAKKRNWEGMLVAATVCARMEPLDPLAHRSRGLALYELGRFTEARAAYEKALKINPSDALTWMKLAAAYSGEKHFPTALACHERSVALEPDNPELIQAYGSCLSHWGDYPQAEAQFRRALSLRYDYQTEAALGATLLMEGKWAEGWRRFEARWGLIQFGTTWNHRGADLWAGTLEDMRGKRVLVRAEQGHGDTIQCARYIPLLARMAASVSLDVAPSLARLLEGLGAAVLVRGKSAPPMRSLGGIVQMREPPAGFDVQVTMMTLPRLFETHPGNCPPPASFRVLPRTLRGPRVGICWHGGARPHDPVADMDDRRRSIPWEDFAPITEVVPCVSLQEEDLYPNPKLYPGDWYETAQTIFGLDLVITVDTGLAHLAASLGVETWILLRRGGCWRWLSFGERTCWYPDARLYRQPVLDEWGVVISQVCADLRKWKARQPCNFLLPEKRM